MPIENLLEGDELKNNNVIHVNFKEKKIIYKTPPNLKINSKPDFFPNLSNKARKELKKSQTKYGTNFSNTSNDNSNNVIYLLKKTTNYI